MPFSARPAMRWLLALTALAAFAYGQDTHDAHPIAGGGGVDCSRYDCCQSDGDCAPATCGNLPQACTCAPYPDRACGFIT